MKIHRREFLLKTLITAGAINSAIPTGCTQQKLSRPLRKAIEYLWAQQNDDGGFHSSTYGLLGSGQSLTPFVLLSLLNISEAASLQPKGAVDRAFEFIKSRTSSDGILGIADKSAADYPNYATALAVSAIIKSRISGYEKLADKMIDQLRAQQFREANGWSTKYSSYGGWGMGGALRPPPEPGHVDLSMTRHVLEALQNSGITASDNTMKRALIFLERCQNADGGFFFSPVNPEINKAGKDTDGSFISYGTATADGIMALHAIGLHDSDQRITRAIKWIRDHHIPDRASGYVNESDKIWGLGLRFYYAHAVSRVLPELPVSLPPQADDGSFRNDNNLVKEDDPLIATTFALYALNRNSRK